MKHLRAIGWAGAIVLAFFAASFLINGLTLRANHYLTQNLVDSQTDPNIRRSMTDRRRQNELALPARKKAEYQKAALCGIGSAALIFVLRRRFTSG